MLERSRIWAAFPRWLAAVAAGAALGLSGCASITPEEPATAVAAVPPPAPAPVAAAARPARDPGAGAEEARALLAQAETDIQRARARRALWSKAWEALVGARASLAAEDHAGAIRQARRASELAQLGLEQLAYPAVKYANMAGQPAESR
jgi:hypothetical protein